MTTQARPYAGVDAADRLARRHANLLEAGLELLGGDADPAELTVPRHLPPGRCRHPLLL